MQWISLVAAMAFLGGAAGFFVGVERAGAHPGASSPDVEFLHEMSLHHEQAIQLSLLEIRHGGSPAIKKFATEIHYFQAYEIGAMERTLQTWGFDRQDFPLHRMPGMASDEEMDALADARGEAADALFVRLMQDHHRGGVAMAAAAAEDAETGWVRDLAARMAKQQRTEITEMERALAAAGLEPNPAGWTPDSFDATSPSEDDHSGH